MRQVAGRMIGRSRLGAECALLAILLVLGCAGGAEESSDPVRPGQITRPGDAGLPLDDPRAVQAFERADALLLNWFIQRDPNAALQHFSSNLRAGWSSIVSGALIEGHCSFRQVEGSLPDQSGTVVARYAVDGCRIALPGQQDAAHVNVTATVTDQNAWVTSIEFE